MVIATFLGVFPLAMFLQVTLSPLIRDWPFVVRNAAFNAAVVVLLAWAVIPVVTRILHRRLQPEHKATVTQ